MCKQIKILVFQGVAERASEGQRRLKILWVGCGSLGRIIEKGAFSCTQNIFSLQK